ncbi:ATP-binding protein [Haladaptatus sp. DYSN1]|uniref:ATP-binding protein n=1 Tax=unclassified Haladaptatus TaxID=2622732 RepID=UPI002407014F|nr:DUF87 domain-containing protein [Haladaptatus sp. DYSN1]
MPVTDAPTDDRSTVAENHTPYLRIRPTDHSLHPETVTRHLRRVHGLGPETSGGVLSQLSRRTPDPPTIEFLLVSDGAVDTTIDYYVGIDDGSIDVLERILRGLFPNTYELTRVDDETPLPAFSDDSTLAAVEFLGKTDRTRDWQTQLTLFEEFQHDEHSRFPLTAIVETMAESRAPLVYQTLIRPKPDWSRQAEERRIDIEGDLDTFGGKLSNAIWGPPLEGEHTLTVGDETRLDELAAKGTRRSFDVNARALAIGTDELGEPTKPIRELATAFGDVSHTCYEILSAVHTDKAAQRVHEDIHAGRFYPADYDRLSKKLPWTKNTSRAIVADAREASNFCLLSGDALTAAGKRAIAPTPGERTSLPRPPADQLRAYTDGLLFGHPLTQDGATIEQGLSLPPALQPLHVAWFGKTGSGKSTALVNAILENQAATGGANILIDPKGDGMGEDYCRAHFARYGDLENVRYFDCSEVLPAFSFFDIRDELEAGVERTTAVEDTVDHYIEILTQIMGKRRFEQAVRSPDIIRYLVKALFDPVNGDDAFSHRELHEATRRMHERQSAPAVSDEGLERMLGGVVANRARSFDEIMQGVANRMEKIPLDKRLARIFNHVADEEGEGPHFDLAEFLDEDTVIIFDTGGLRKEAQRVVTLVILSNLWTALRRRTQQGNAEDDHPLVNLYVEEAASVAVTDLLNEFLAKSRSFGCSVTLAMQFPGQLREASERAYNEVLNNVSTFVTGNVPIDRRLARRLSTEDMDATEVGNRLRALDRGQWFVKLPAAFGESEPRPFVVESAPLPPGDPEGTQPLTAGQTARFADTFEETLDRTYREAGLTLYEPSVVSFDEETPSLVRVDTALAHTKRMPETVEYDGEINALRCVMCDNRYDRSVAGMTRAIECCSSLEKVDRDDIPVCSVGLKLTEEEREASEWSDLQLLFLQVVYNAQQLRYDDLEYDLTRDSMIRLQEYVGIESSAVQDLLDADVLRHDTDHPHRLFSVTPEGRRAIGESYRQGIDYGHGKGDLEESSQHVFAVEVLRRYMERGYVDDPESSVVEVVPYYEIREGGVSAADFMGSGEELDGSEEFEMHRLDCVGLDADDEILIVGEAERINHDYRRAVPEDYDKMAACEPEEAIWVVMDRKGGHSVLSALNDPTDGKTRVGKTYVESTPPNQFRIDAPGLTQMYSVAWLRDNMAKLIDS